jgi:hypothetical protein
MELRELLNFSDARIVQIAAYPSEKGVKCVLMLAASLMPEHAERLQCAYIYKDGIPVEGLEDFALDGQLRDMELHLPTAHDRQQFQCYYPELIHRIKIKRVEDAKFEVIFRIHEARRRADIDALLEAVNKDTFECAIRPRQGELFEGGTRVEVSSTDAKKRKRQPAEADEDEFPRYVCPQCDADVPLDDTGTQHIDADGIVTACEHPARRLLADVKASRKATLASKREMSHA